MCIPEKAPVGMSSHGSWLYPASGQLSRNSNFRVAPNDNEMILRAWICWSIGDKFERFLRIMLSCSRETDLETASRRQRASLTRHRFLEENSMIRMPSNRQLRTQGQRTGTNSPFARL